MRSAIGSTIALALALAGAGAAGGCGASQAEIRAATRSGYDADFAIVYTQALAAVTALYPHINENASIGQIKTAWHPVKYAEGQDDPRTQQTRDVASTTPTAGPTPGTRSLVKRYFIRFDVNVVGGNPWRVRVVGQASEWEAGAVPVELKGGNEPHWLKGRTEALQVAIYRRLKQYAVKLDVDDDKAADEGAASVDLTALGNLPGDAAQVVGAVLVAAKARDGQKLKLHMAEIFSWSLGADPSADMALAMWQADPAVYGALAQTIEAGCSVDGDAVTCPAAYASTPGFSGYRAGFRRGADGLWKMTFFLQGQ